uniref:Uncharacterized protein n=1 Tax=Globisporangium ultimum (strain ATCC 200006 / CBS 805.95 / DAOM BR144) TaxID=431595 RepID=K3WUT2_GLOUD
MLFVRMRLLYGAAAMSAGVFVFSYLQEREEREDQEQLAAERVVKTEHFFHAMEQLQLSSQQRLEMRKFWRNLCNKYDQMRTNRAGEGEESSADRAAAGLLPSAPGAIDRDTTAKISVGDIQRFAQEYKKVFPDIFPEQQVLDATEIAAEATMNAWNGIVESTSTMILSTGKRLNDIAKDTKGGVELAMHRTVRKYLERALDIVADRLKQALKDPHMPKYLKSNIDIAIEQFMPDVKVEIFRKTRALFRKTSSGALLTADPLSLFRRVRGHILYHLFPHNKSIWMSFKDPWWIAFSSVGVFPVVGQLWWLFLFLIKDKTNEHQLCQFIIGFKVAQFITLGIFHSMLGIISYVRCIILGSLDMCQEGGPALEMWNAFFFILQIALVWTAFFRLPYTDRPQEPRHPLVYRKSSASMNKGRERKVYHDVFGNELHLDRGGYLMKFCGYETISFAIIVVLVCIVLYLPFETWQRKALLYWIRTAYGLFSLPFVAFKIPILANVLMHTRRMGYNNRGETVRMTKNPEF